MTQHVRNAELMLDARHLAALTFAPPSTRAPGAAPAMAVRGLDFWYGDKHALKDVSLEIAAGETTAFIGPSGCGKSTFLKCLNRMHDDTDGARLTGDVRLDGEDIYAAEIDPPVLRRRFGWVAQKPDPFPWSVWENVSYGPRIHGLAESQDDLMHIVQRALERAGLWDELKDRLDEPGTDLSGGQQQRLCIARALASEPDVLLMDEPCGSLDPRATARIEELILGLRGQTAVVIITHNMEQAARVAQWTAFFKLGEVLEFGETRQVFTAPRHPACAEYLSGKFG